MTFRTPLSYGASYETSLASRFINVESIMFGDNYRKIENNPYAHAGSHACIVRVNHP